MGIMAEFKATTASRLMGLLAGAVVLILCLHFGHVSGLTTGLQNSLTEARAAASQRPASGKVVLLAIDKQSIDHIGQWPWPRSVHARIIDRLTEAGVSEMALDIDFSTASNPQDDKASPPLWNVPAVRSSWLHSASPSRPMPSPENCRPTCPSAACCNTPGPVRSTCWPTKTVWSGASLMARPSAVSSCPPFRPCWPPHRVRKETSFRSISPFHQPKCLSSRSSHCLRAPFLPPLEAARR
jgi:hypothetical protein